MMKKNILRSIILCTCVILFTYKPIQSQSENFKYAYIMKLESKKVEIWLIDPAIPDETDLLLTIPFPKEYDKLNTTFETLASPDGEWIQLIFFSSQSHLKNLQVIDVDTGQSRDVFRAFITQNISRTEQTLPVWSPNSYYLAFNIQRQSDGEVNTYIYSLVSDTVIPIPTAGRPYQLAWSTDSAQLAVLSWVSCNGSDISCGKFIETFSIPDGTRRFVTHKINDFPGEPCNFEWSPSNQNLSFILDCTDFVGQYFRDIYILDISTSTISPLTEFTCLNEPCTTSFGAGYNTTWYDEQTLLAGIVVEPLFSEFDPNSVTVETAAYQWPSGKSIILTKEVAKDWEINPVMKKIAFRLEAIESLPESTCNDQTALSLKDASVKIATFSGHSLDISANGPPGCNLRWSPNGKFLAYENHGAPWQNSSQCYGSVQGILFIDGESGEITEHSLLESDDILIRPIGWVLTTNK